MKKRSSILLFVAGVILVLATACDVGPSEGSTCNALVVDNECTGATTCQSIGSCSATFCCPADPTTSTDPHCNGTLCPPLPPDGGDDLVGDASGNDAETQAVDAGTD